MLSAQVAADRGLLSSKSPPQHAAARKEGEDVSQCLTVGELRSQPEHQRAGSILCLNGRSQNLKRWHLQES